MLVGSIVALVTPMDAHGDIDYVGLENLVNYHIDSGTSAIVVMGTTGESATLTAAERLTVIQKSVEVAAGRIPIIAGTSANATAKAVAVTQQLENSGVAACITVTPYYNRPTQEGLWQHFSCIAHATTLPQILYNVPHRTGCDLQPETIARLAELPNIIGIKEATGDLRRVTRLRTLIRDPQFKLLSGDDATALDFMRLGGDGVISVLSNIAAKTVARMCQLVAIEDRRDGQLNEAQRLNQLCSPLYQSLSIESNPIPIKWACHRLGLIASDMLRLPLTKLSSEAQLQVEPALRAAKLLP